jgi:polyisoprenoid-binding protein YceI
MGFEGSFKLNRRDYGMKWEMPNNPSWIGDNLTVQIDVLARPS